MTVPNLSTGDTITETWTDAVTTQLNNLPLAVVAGRATGLTSDAAGLVEVSYGVTFASTPTVVVTRGSSNATDPIIGHIDDVSTGTTDFWFRCFSGTSRQDNVSAIDLNWIAVGELA